MVPSGEMTLARIEHVLFGQPAAGAIQELVERRDSRRVFLVASETLRRSSDEIVRIEARLAQRWAGTWSGVRSHVPGADVIAVADAVRAADADLIVAIGGGSVVDAAKIAPLVIEHDVASVDGLEMLRTKVDAAGTIERPVLRDPRIRLICVPTTLSGGEFSQSAGARDERTKIKHGYYQPGMAPWAIVLDPAITRHTPQWLWLSTGVRSLDHAIETLASLRSNPVADGVADTAIRLLASGLEGSKVDPADLDARLSCQMGAWQSMLPLVGGVPMGASHAISSMLGAGYDVPHGYSSCVTLPAVLAWNAGHDAGRQKRISAALGMADEAAPVALKLLLGRLGLPTTLREVGVPETAIPEITRRALGNQWIHTNPRPITSAEDVIAILRLAA
jgi:alcohol dehydrogenase class IV